MDHRRRTYYSPRRRAALDAWLVSHPRDIAECAAAERPGAELTARANRDLSLSRGG